MDREGGPSVVRAIHDVGCLTAVKLSYHFPQVVTYDMMAGFGDCDIIVRTFSKAMSLARDFVAVRRPGEFRAEFVVGGTRAVVYFDGSIRTMPRASIEAFAQRLGVAGYDRILYSESARPHCDHCPAGVLKGCGGVLSQSVPFKPVMPHLPPYQKPEPDTPAPSRSPTRNA